MRSYAAGQRTRNGGLSSLRLAEEQVSIMSFLSRDILYVAAVTVLARLLENAPPVSRIRPCCCGVVLQQRAVHGY